jgi:hypothetical protein
MVVESDMVAFSRVDENVPSLGLPEGGSTGETRHAQTGSVLKVDGDARL